ncbi:MAG: hypothetical protein IJD01_08235 [Clostridia bacterium]|nr:hypothetical protein [Clostridia bacterium]
MSRVKHAVMLAIKAGVIVLCFAVATMFTALAGMDTSVLDGMKGQVAADACEITVMDAMFASNGASLSYEVADGRIIFDLVQRGTAYDDVTVFLEYPAFAYDADAMRDYLQETIGDRAAQEEAYLAAMEAGPWNLNYSFQMTGDGTNEGSYGTSYTVVDPDLEGYAAVLKAEGENEPFRIDNIYAEKGDELSFMLIFGSETFGALPSGRYVFEADLGVSGLYEGQSELSFGTKMSVITSTCMKALQEQGLDIFRVENWLVFYGAMIVTGMFVYLWRDLRSMKKIFGAMLEERHPPVRVIVTVYVNGYVTDQYSYIDDGTSMIAAFFVTLLCYVLFLLTYPLRILIHIVRDIVCLIKDDEEIEDYSLVGNILGSVGVYVLLFGVVGLLGASYLLGGICAAVGIGMCVGAHFLCKATET